MRELLIIAYLVAILFSGVLLMSDIMGDGFIAQNDASSPVFIVEDGLIFVVSK